MDAHRFDSLAKTLTPGPGSRRATLRAFAGLALSGLLGLADAEAKRKKNKNNKRKAPIKPGERCKKKRKKLGDCVEGAFCNSDGYCKCLGCHYAGACFPGCGGRCCDDAEICCLAKRGERVCHLPNLTCGACMELCGDKCCALSQYCTRCADYSFKCTATPGESC